MGAPFPSPRRPGRLQRILAALSLRRADRAIEDRGGINWSPGDMAECIHDGPWYGARGELVAEPRRGTVLIVRDVRLADWRGRTCLFLVFGRWPDRLFAAAGFRKLTPRADAATAADADFLQQLKQGAVPSSPVPSIAARLKRILS